MKKSELFKIIKEAIKEVKEAETVGLGKDNSGCPKNFQCKKNSDCAKFNDKECVSQSRSRRVLLFLLYSFG